MKRGKGDPIKNERTKSEGLEKMQEGKLSRERGRWRTGLGNTPSSGLTALDKIKKGEA